MNREPRNINSNDVQYEILRAHQGKYVRDNDTHKDSFPFPWDLQ